VSGKKVPDTSKQIKPVQKGATTLGSFAHLNVRVHFAGELPKRITWETTGTLVHCQKKNSSRIKKKGPKKGEKRGKKPGDVEKGFKKSTRCKRGRGGKNPDRRPKKLTGGKKKKALGEKKKKKTPSWGTRVHHRAKKASRILQSSARRKKKTPSAKRKEGTDQPRGRTPVSQKERAVETTRG